MSREYNLNPQVSRMGELLLDGGLVDSRQLRAALVHQRNHGGKMAECLIRLGFLRTRTYQQFLYTWWQAKA